MTTKTSTAQFIKRIEKSPEAAQALYRLNPPIVQTGYNEDGEYVSTHEYVVVSSIVAPYSGPETYIFAADETGKIVEWMELEGSFRGEPDHGRALRNAGYTTIFEPALDSGNG